ncbi:MAG: redoxin domain-containing protein [Syntrophales bacterium]|nr:redoxin domain-containing protein [Syntrophales bacterium]
MFIFVLLLLPSLVCGISTAGSLVGKVAPPFRVESADGKIMDNRSLKGKVVVLFYESKDVLDKSRPVKNHLLSFYERQEKKVQERVARVAVLACRTAVWPFKGIWKQRMLEKSRQSGITVYGDWDGSMEKSFGFDADDTNLIIMDPQGVVRYARTGAVSPRDAGPIVDLLTALVAEEYGRKR